MPRLACGEAVLGACIHRRRHRDGDNGATWACGRLGRCLLPLPRLYRGGNLTAAEATFRTSPNGILGPGMVEAVKHEIDRIGMPEASMRGGNLTAVQFPGNTPCGSDTLFPYLGNVRAQRFGVFEGGGIGGGQLRISQLGSSGLRCGQCGLCPL